MTESDFAELNGAEAELDEDSPKPEKKGKKGALKKKEAADGSENGAAQGGEPGRMKALEAALADLTKRFGDGTIVRLGDAGHLAVEVIPTGSLTTDIASGVGGIPRGRITEVFGPESSGKTTLMLSVIASAQRAGGLAATAESDRHFATDNPLTGALLALVRAAAHPGDSLAQRHVQMTPLGARLAQDGITTGDALTAPVLGTNPPTAFSRVDLPAPFVPISPMTSPGLA